MEKQLICKEIIEKYHIRLRSPGYEYVGRKNGAYCFRPNGIKPNSIQVDVSISKEELQFVIQNKQEILNILRSELPVFLPCNG
jgi:hypothetical protein